MATGTIPTAVVPPPPPATDRGRDHERVIHRQLGRTSFHVRLVDLASSLAMLVVGLLGFLLAAALVDHWVMSLGVWGRSFALVLLVGGTLWYLVARVGPLVIKSINPSFAARTIEEATPSLKNSLINFLLLRQDRGGVREVVYEAVEARAAADIADVPVEATVDRSRLIRAGYVLCAAMALLAAYKILSPKDPFQTAARVAMPWAEIARPSRVEISHVVPGTADVYHGQIVEVSAELHGVRDGESVTLLFSTADGQTVERAVEMSPAGGLRYTCKLPSEERQSLAAGMQQDLTYRLIAGDAETPPYKLTVVAAPTIIVERLDYEYPAYTKKPPLSVPQQGDLHGLEGTRVTLHVVANQPIKSAWIEFDPGVKGVAPETVKLAADGSQARGTVTLQLKADRLTAWHGSYQVRFYNDRGQQNQQPIVHEIEVIRDLPPEVQLLKPQKVRVEVPEDGEVAMEVRGVDPDFGLSRLRIEGKVSGEGKAGGERKVAVDLLPADAGQVPQAAVPQATVPQATVPLAFRPRDHQLKAGDELKYAAVAEDNRTSPLTGKPEPNVARTTEYTLVVLAPTKPNEGGGEQNPPPMPGAHDKPPQQGEKNPPQQNPNQTNQNQANQNQTDKNQTDKGQPQPNQENKQPGDKPMGGQQQGGQPMGGQQQSGQPMGGQQQSGQPMGGQQQSGQPMGGQQQSGQPMGGQQQSGQPMGGQQQSGQPMGGQQQGGLPMGGQQQQSGQSGDSSGNPSGRQAGEGPRQDKAHDGEAIEQVVKNLQQQGGQQSGQPNNQQGSSQQGTSQQGTPQQGSQQQGAGEKNTQGNPSPMPDSQAKPDGQPMPGGQGQVANPKTDQRGQPMPGQTGQGQNSQGNPQPGADKQPSAAAGGGEKLMQPGDKPMDQGTGRQPGQGAKPDPMNRQPGDNQGENPSQQPGGQNSGGKPMGPNKTDQGQPSPQSAGQEKNPGAGQTGDEGAGGKSQDKTGSGTGQDQNRDRPKEQRPDNAAPKEGDPSAGSNSKKQSDSQGGNSGDQSGGGKKGAGQSAGQEGNDSPGSKSAADQGAGAAQQQGSGQTGSKAGTQQEAAGKTGQSGDKTGEGSQTKSDAQGNQIGKSGQPQPGQKPDQPPGQRPDAQQGDPSDQPGGRAGGKVVTGGGDGNRPQIDYGESPEAQAADAANLDYARKATELALQKLKDQEHNPDPELLKQLGWTKEDLAEFLNRWNSLQESADKSPAGKRELDEALRSLGLRDPANRKRAGGAASDSQRDLRDSGGRSSPPPKYRDLFDAFRKGRRGRAIDTMFVRL